MNLPHYKNGASQKDNEVIFYVKMIKSYSGWKARGYK